MSAVSHWFMIKSAGVVQRPSIEVVCVPDCVLCNLLFVLTYCDSRNDHVASCWKYVPAFDTRMLSCFVLWLSMAVFLITNCCVWRKVECS